MRTEKLWPIAVLVGFMVAPLPGRAMNMPSYDVVSLVYLSTDIVIADLWEDSQKKFTATVAETLYGAVKPGEKLDTLTPFLSFFSPMKDGMRVVLFLDRRPRKYGFLLSDLANSPFAIPPSGVLLIDQYQHVHSYYQMQNSGPYVAEGWWSIPKLTEPAKDDDLKLPSLDEEKVKIAAAIRSVATVRPLLERTATRADAPALLKLLDRTSTSTDDCDLRLASAITEKATEQIRSLNDAELLLQAHIRAGDVDSLSAADGFINQTPGFESDDDKQQYKFAGERGQFLVQTLGNPKEDLEVRLAAARILLLVSAWNHPYSGTAKVLPIDAKALAGSADALRAASRTIFDDEAQDGNLRGLCLEFLLDQPGELEDARRVYSHTKSIPLRFMIEELFLEQGDKTYEMLHSPNGAVASIVGPATFCGCMKMDSSSSVLLAKWRERKDLHGSFATVSSDIERRPVLTSLKTGQRYVMNDYDDLGYTSGSDGSGWWQFRLKHLDHVPAGDYSIALEYIENGNVLSSGYNATVSIKEAREGKQLTIDRARSSAPPVGWVD